MTGLDRRANRYKLWCQLRPELVSTRRQWPEYRPHMHTVVVKIIELLDFVIGLETI